MSWVKITVTCPSGHEVGNWKDKIAEKYPFYCDTCDDLGDEADLRRGKYPWELTTEIVNEPVFVPEGGFWYERGYNIGVYSTEDKAREAMTQSEFERGKPDFWDIHRFTLDNPPALPE